MIMANRTIQLGHYSTHAKGQSHLILDVKEPSTFLQGINLKQRKTQQF